MPNAVLEGLSERISIAIKVNLSVGIQLPENRHTDLLQALFNFMKSGSNERWAFVSINNTYDHLLKNYKVVSELKNTQFIDCISAATGTTHDNPKQCVYIQSPTMLERVWLEILQCFRGTSEETEKYVVIDSLSSLVIYNDTELVREFVSLLLNRTRSDNIHIVTVLIEEEVDSNKLLQLNDKIIVLRDSFIE